MITIHRQKQEPKQPKKWDLWVNEETGDVRVFNGKKFEVFNPEKLPRRMPVTVAFEPDLDVLMDIYVNGERKIRIYNDKTFEIIGGVSKHAKG